MGPWGQSRLAIKPCAIDRGLDVQHRQAIFQVDLDVPGRQVRVIQADVAAAVPAQGHGPGGGAMLEAEVALCIEDVDQRVVHPKPPR